MKYLSILLLLILTVTTFAQPKRKWKQLFNGKDIKDWTVKISGHEVNENFGNTFRVVDKKLTVSYDHYDQFNNQFGHIFYKSPYSYYIIAVEYRFIGKQATGGPIGPIEIVEL
jgi:hypothetical protein